MKRRTRKHIDKPNWGTQSAADEYSVVEYILGDGPPDDPGSTIHRRIAVFVAGEEPEDFQAALSEAIKGSRWEFEGLKEPCLLDEYIGIVQEGDADANDHREADERMLDRDRTPHYWRQSGGSNGVTYEQFLAAVDVVAADYENEEAWVVIDKWRQRQLREDERG